MKVTKYFPENPGIQTPRSLYFLTALFFVTMILASPVQASGYIDPKPAMEKAILKATSDSLKIMRLFDLAFYYNDVMDKRAPADSTSEVAIRVAEMSFKPGLLVLAYNKYVESNDVSAYREKAGSYALKAIQICRITPDPLMEWRSCTNLFVVYLENRDYNNALDMSNRAMSIAMELNNDSLHVLSELNIGKSLQGKNQKVEAFRQFLNATDLAGKMNNTRLLIRCYYELARFYDLNKLSDEAIRYKLKEGELIKKLQPVDSVAIMFAQYELQCIDRWSNSNHLNEKNIEAVIDYARRTRHDRLKNFEFAIYRQYLIENEKMSLLYDVYLKKYPEELNKIRVEDPSMYYRLLAFFKEVEKKPDSAYFYFRKSEELIRNDPNTIRQSTFYNRFGQFLVRQGKVREAIEKFNASYRIAESDKYFAKFDFMMVAARQLESLYAKVGDYKNAFTFSQLNRVITDSISRLSKKEQVILMDINEEAQKRQKASELEKQRIERTVHQRKTERNMFAGGVLFFLILSFVIFRSYRNQKKLNHLLDEQRKKSDELLLNILPFETAEELKRDGTTQAKRFDEVTVMFTDFKDFTQASEKMGADELVKSIHFYFSEFDRIIEKNNLEKIKIIGDSYMCAGGIPVANKTHAKDVVMAALELQSFMKAQKRDKLLKGEPFFELRIGIHTGPVVAGIVGIRKFAYDIWGDTVNTASRMENCGETEKVNVSGSTFEQIKDRFSCEYRGKVAAKHKGEIDMYFVVPPDGFE